MEIHVENFPNLSSIFEQLEQRNRRGAISSIEPNAAKIHNQERKPRSSTVMEAQPTKRSTVGRVASDSTGHKSSVVQPRARIRSAPCYSMDLAQLQGDTRLTDAAKKTEQRGAWVAVMMTFLSLCDVFSIIQERKNKQVND
ncbi:hypothetical protein OS493_030151 [Desmophyllum pertusum]|uniref:Uncharacterized protein n=1 Tax=Desmophyllum pertusum TaxID=174260 RepID=A0A9W9YWM2_9CNID|nr:hypothetical protein OS493_030151 [Desmophyllum pertusum]